MLLTNSAWRLIAVSLLALAVVGALASQFYFGQPNTSSVAEPPVSDYLRYRPRKALDTSGFMTLLPMLPAWSATASLQEVGQASSRLGWRVLEKLDQFAAGKGKMHISEQIDLLLARASAFCFEGRPQQAYDALVEARRLALSDDVAAEDFLYTIIYYQGITGLRRGEDENCIMCRGESSCILPIQRSAIHANPLGSRRAIEHFTEYLQQFPDDLGVRWLLNLAHMTLGEHPERVDPRHLVTIDAYLNSEFDIGKFRDIGAQTGVNRLNQAGGAIMDDFDNDGLLDIVITSWDATQSMTFFRNKGNGTFADRTKAAGLTNQLGGLYCVQTDYNNDGHLDVFIPRGAWIMHAIRPSLLRNNGDGTFSDVTEEAGLITAVNSISATWADYDNDGFLDLFVCCERQRNLLYHNTGKGTFEEVSGQAGVAGDPSKAGKGAAWIDFDNDCYPDLFLNNFNGAAQLFKNNRNGTFSDVTSELGVAGPRTGFSCWAWDFDNDGWLDIFATSYERPLEDIVRGLMGEPHRSSAGKLYRNDRGGKFQDVTKEAGLDLIFATMGSNFGDFDNDGYLDFYLGTGDPNLSTLVPNRMFKNVGGKRFADISASSGVGHLQKGHGVACGDWNRDGNVDIFIEMGGATEGDKYHNILFQNPGQGNHWLTVKLVGQKTNRAAIGARLKIVTHGAEPRSIHRHVSSGSSFGANPLEQTVGLGKAEQIALLEVVWPTSGTTQTFRDLAVNQSIEIVEFAPAPRLVGAKPIPTPN